MKNKICCICGKEFTEWGNNPDGAKWLDENGKIVCPTFDPDDVCCDECNGRYVLTGRMYDVYKRRD